MSNTVKQALAFDFGTLRIGIAAGQSITGTATPLEPIAARDGIPNWDQLAKIISEWTPDALIIGIPLNYDGTISDMAYRARKFANRLHERYKVPCFLMDERLSTAEAKAIHFAAGGSDNFKKESVDGIAAQLILESWFNCDIRIPSHTRLEDVYDLKHA
ncbi:Holliday junction resolvase RuvX [Neptuniibacter pectenicola]|jgi:putative Holliday junction resolvase|uniref:Putative pre-16S rRNA nuclease n=1 Tax=Neptuniibacter pectenicola TaxID=1806669 RepID=A0ABU9TT86_9GAMM|nr:Holliday junction resolvase RuvX [Neptuniibacter pectenicola]|tara:strand:- start:2508 stop:2984 length:477 start_codon:yes stop_codon:yes gene_type:complete|eukprot:gnl/Carplike_NY0171/10411_a14675_98.p1 GENE.gnl/Carplike_NY0171/10411_a14675_98~~gnl/Carplike_NY0171/10411_a14675_98.p1  ORF type:complete len:159 (+),score=3.02 gnl/Carplike_NY0171/10411_a14675_98:223-699(+)